MSKAPPRLEPLAGCPLCGGPGGASLLPAEAGVGVVRCGDCGLVHATGQYAAEFLSEDFYAGRAGPASTDTAARPGAARKRRNVALYDRLSGGKIGRPRPGARALDLGCNTGLLLDVLRELGYRTEGIERSPAGERALAAGHTVHALDIETHELGLPRYDLITLTHVLEHLRRPVAGLVWIRRHLAAGGVAVVEVPNWGDRMRPLWGRRYRPLELGDHVSFFERSSLQAAAERAGLTVLQMWSAPQAGTLVIPSLLTAMDLALSLRASLRGRGGTGDLAANHPVVTGVAAPRAVSGNLAGRLRRSLTPAVLATLDGLDPALEAMFGPECRWGANLVAILAAGRA
ncbi:MAG: class I SAM-dependent methyltransferase [Nannocystis sp.]|nr:class I SAM-dependent methyltransferase [Nannocystis sp.]MBA3548175.1 class I SAM-dependent methyltransferase [Nannocystis sp.]